MMILGLHRYRDLLLLPILGLSGRWREFLPRDGVIVLTAASSWRLGKSQLVNYLGISNQDLVYLALAPVFYTYSY